MIVNTQGNEHLTTNNYTDHNQQLNTMTNDRMNSEADNIKETVVGADLSSTKVE